MPSADVNVLYMNDWNAAAKDPTERWLAQLEMQY